MKSARMSSPKPDFSVPRRQSPAAIVLILARTLRALVGQFWPLLLVFLLNPKARSGDVFQYVLWIIPILSAIGSTMAYFRFHYYIEGDEVVLERGIFRRVRLTIPFERMQSIQLEQNLLHRLLGVVQLEVSTAGSRGSEFRVTALERQQAEAFRRFLLQQRRVALETSDAEPEQEPSDQLLLALHPEDVLKVGLGANHLRTTGLLIALALGFLNDLENALGQTVYEQLSDALGLNTDHFLSTLLFLFVSLLLISFVLSMLIAFARFYQLRLYRTESGFRLISGLLNRREEMAPVRKIQFIRWSYNPLEKLLGMQRIRLMQASSTDQGHKESMLIPGAYPQQVEAVQQAYSPKAGEQTWENVAVSPRVARRRFILTGLLPVAVLVLLSVRSYEAQVLWSLVWLVPAWLLSLRYYRNWKIRVSAAGILTEQGTFGRTYNSLRWHKVQSVALRQSWIQKRVHHTDLIFYTAAGQVLLPYIELGRARQLVNYVLSHVEQSRLEWM
jgi:putative membrane protein